MGGGGGGRRSCPPVSTAGSGGAGTSSLEAAGKGSLKHCMESPKVLVWAEFQEAGQVGTKIPQGKFGVCVYAGNGVLAHEGIKATAVTACTVLGKP